MYVIKRDAQGRVSIFNWSFPLLSTLIPVETESDIFEPEPCYSQSNAGTSALSSQNVEEFSWGPNCFQKPVGAEKTHSVLNFPKCSGRRGFLFLNTNPLMHCLKKSFVTEISLSVENYNFQGSFPTHQTQGWFGHCKIALYSLRIGITK